MERLKAREETQKESDKVEKKKREEEEKRREERKKVKKKSTTGKTVPPLWLESSFVTYGRSWRDVPSTFRGLRGSGECNRLAFDKLSIPS